MANLEVTNENLRKEVLQSTEMINSSIEEQKKTENQINGLKKLCEGIKEKILSKEIKV